jgi:phenylpyruvate tautomerase PptA (4-oxalocrotonate tautomerase family)
MPTYVCSVASNRWTAQQKQHVAQAIAVNHSAATGAPPNLVHVIVQDNEGTMRFVGGEPEEEHVWIIGYIRRGRTDAQIGRLAMSIVRSVSRITGTDACFVWVYICNIDSGHMAKYGSIHPAPGKETAWFEALPMHVKAYMARNSPPPEADRFLDPELADER